MNVFRISVMNIE